MNLDDASPKNKGDKQPRLEDQATVYKFPPGKFVTIRLLQGMNSQANYWVRTKKRDGSASKFSTGCPSYDAATQNRDSSIYDPWRDLAAAQYAEVRAGTRTKEDIQVQFGMKYLFNAIIRSDEKAKPARLPKHTREESSTGHKERDSDSWTPVQIVRLPPSIVAKIKDLKNLNVVESRKTGSVKSFSLDDPRFGRDIRIQHNPDKPPSDQYTIQQADERTELDDDQTAYLTWDLESICATSFDEAAVRADYESWAERAGIKKPAPSRGRDTGGLDEHETPKKKSAIADDFDEDEAPKKKPVAADFDEDEAPKAKKKAAPADDFDEDEAPAPKAKKKPAADDFDEDEDEVPAPKKKEKSAPEAAKKAKKPVVEEDDDLDF